VQPDPVPPGPPGADSGATSAPPSRQNAEAGAHTGTGLPADAQPRPWRALLTCGHRVEVVQLTPGPATPPATVECPRCGVRQPVEIYPLTALSDPENVGWVLVDTDEDDR
jgi:hypothetical protein